MKRVRIQKPRPRRRVVLEDALEPRPPRSSARPRLIGALDELLAEIDRVLPDAKR